MKKKVIIAVLLAATLSLLWSSVASAAFCVVAKKADGAGTVGWVLLDTDFEFVDTNLAPNPGGQIAGGFVDIYMDINGSGTPEPFELIINDTFLLPSALGDPAELPHGAHNAGPGDDGCDGIGVDDVLDC
jgi:hypothetical protein